MDGKRSGRRRWEWWHRQTTATRRALRTAATLLVTGLLAASLGVSTASTHSSLGPHKADYHVTLDRQVSVQLGPLGAVIIDSPLPWPLGVAVVVEEIPSDLAGGSSPLPGLMADVQSYGHLLSAPEAAVADAVRGLVGDALGRTAVAWSAMLVLLAAARLASRGRLRDEVKAALARPGVAALCGAVAVSVIAAVVVPAARQHSPAGSSPAVLEGTPLEGARITGRLADVVAAYGPVVKEAYLSNERFYDRAADNVVAAFEADPQPRGPAPAEEAGGATDGAGESTDGDTHDEAEQPGVAAGDGVAAAPSATEAGDGDGETAPDPVTLLLVSDLHCNVGMARVVAAALEQSGAAALLDAGDTVMSGTSVESYCVNAFANAVPDDVPVVVATGNHDSETTAGQEREAGWTVLAGEVVEVAGVRILGETDPTLTAVGAGGTRPERGETIPELARRMAEVACATDDGVDLLLVHNPRVGQPALDAGCARLQLSGHWHRTEGPEVLGQGVRYVSSSTGGGAEGRATVGPLSADAELTVVRVDRTTGRPMDLRRIRVGTDASVKLGPWVPMPVPDGAAGVPDGAVPNGTDGGAPDGVGPDGAEADGGPLGQDAAPSGG
ncbi:metallophosphoesterase [Georgenia sp. AZ-5]|uniref:metallophosphoesterase family protein n=1 Tax=Georgenia sp. AZ-5 TaxID=3367526 RepID=UPI003754F1F4